MLFLFDSQNNATDYLSVLKKLWALRLLDKQFMSFKGKSTLCNVSMSSSEVVSSATVISLYSWFSLLYRVTSMIPERDLLSMHVDCLCLQQYEAWRSSFQVRVIKYFKIKHEVLILVLQNFLFLVPWIYMSLVEIVWIRAVLSHC